MGNFNARLEIHSASIGGNTFLHCTGAVHIWAKVPDYKYGGLSNSSKGSPIGNDFLYYVGTCEAHPVSELMHFYRPVFSSAGGPLVPVDKEYLGSVETVTMDLNRFDANVVDYLESAPRYGRAIDSLQNRKSVVFDLGNGTAPSCFNNRLDRGSLLIANKGYFQLWLVYNNFGTDMATPDLPPGWFYYACNTVGCYIPKQGNRIKVRRLIVEANYLPSIGTNTDNPVSYPWQLKTNDEDAFSEIWENWGEKLG